MNAPSHYVFTHHCPAVHFSMIPARPDVPNAEESIDRNHDRVEAAFHKYIHRAEPAEETAEGVQHEFEVIVGHGNVIRYFFCRYGNRRSP